MTLPSSPPITLGQVCAEFGAPSTTPLGSFLRGGSYVPNTPTNSGVPTSLPITLGDLLGASASTYTNITVTSQPADDTTGPYSPAPRPSNTPFSMSRSMTTSGGTVGSIVYSIVNLSGDTGNISVSVSGNGTHTASISGTGTRNRFDDADHSVTFRVKATDGTSTAYSRYVTFTDQGAF